LYFQEDWIIIFALLEYIGAGKVPSGSVTAVSVDVTPQQQQQQGHESDSAINDSIKSVGSGLQHSQSQDPIPILPFNEYSSGSDRGYTSDSELEIRSPVASEHRMSGVSPAQSWILLTHSTPEDNSVATPPSTSPSKIAKTLVQERQQVNFTPDPKALMKSCETLSFLVRDAAHITPDNFTICVSAIRSFVDACTIKLIGKSKTVVDGNVNRKLKRGKKHQSNDHNSLPRSKSFPAHSNDYDADYESGGEAEQAASSQHVSIQVKILILD
jgi:brefeldin A-resistance guanine nucleotide exchange factor 1